jgi:DNA-binding XRE family transcriptional regulator
MGDPQFIRTPTGDELVVLSRADYDDLVARAAIVDEEAEDADDVAIFDARMAELAKPGLGPLPADLSAMVLSSDSFLQALRKWRGKTQVALAEAAGIQQGYLSDLESGRRNGAPDTLERLARALEVPLDWIVR